MQKIIFSAVAFITFNAFAQQPNWNDCQYQQNPQQCMQGVPSWQQTPATRGQEKDPRSGLMQGNSNYQLGSPPVQTNTYKQTNCMTTYNNGVAITNCN